MLIYRIIYLLLLIASFVFSSFYGGYVPSAFRYFLLLVPLLSLTYATLVYVRLGFHQGISEDSVVKGDEVQYCYRIRNNDMIPYLDIRMVFHELFASVGEGESPGRQSLMPYNTGKYNTTICCRYIGSYNVGVSGMEIYDFFHLFRIRYHCRKPLKLSVKPILMKPAAIKQYLIINENKNSFGHSKSSNEVLGCNVRNYIPGDSIRMIHWKNSARANELVTRQYESAVEERTAVVLDTHLAGYAYDIRIALADMILQTAVTLADYFSSNHLGMNIFYDEKSSIQALRVDTDKELHCFCDRCPEINMGMRGTFAHTVGRASSIINGSGSNLVIIGCCNTKDVKGIVMGCLKRDCQVTVINISAKHENDDKQYPSVFEGNNSPLLHVIEMAIGDDICEVLSV